jgi:thioredoxin 1
MKMYSSKETEEHMITTHEGGLTKEQILDVLREMGVE